MADRPPPAPASNHINLPPPSSTTSNPGFTPRSSSFPDDIESDSEDVFDPTPANSPGGPHYDDLPPSYDEAQQQALHDARNGIPPLSPEHLNVSGLHLNEASPQYEIPAGAQVHAHRAAAEGLAKEGSRNVPVQHVQGSENVPVGQTGGTATRTAPQPDQSVLLTAALQFTKHEPDTDVRYAPRLTRCVAIPQDTTVPTGRKGKARARREEKKVEHRVHPDAHIPGAWPAASTDTLPTDVNRSEEPVQFLRAYAKALHAHSIRPAEFLDFLDGLNALCAAAGCTPADLIQPASQDSNPSVELVRSYVDATNEAFFAPRGLKVSLRSFVALLDTAQVPEERSQRAGAVAGVLDPKATPAMRAQALNPWVEALEATVNEPSIAAVMLRDMGEKFRNTSQPLSTSTTRECAEAQVPENEKTRLEREYAERDRASATADNDDPPHSIPGEYPESSDGPRPPFGGWRGRGGRGFRGRGGPWSPFSAPGHGPHGPPGFTPFGPPGHGPHGPPGFGPHGPPGFGPRGPPGFGSSRGQWATRDNTWEALGQHLGKWGEDFGKTMGVWGEQFGKDAAAWGTDLGKQFSGRSESGCGAAGPSTPRASAAASSVPTASRDSATRDVQETGVYRGNSHTTPHDDVAAELEKHAAKKASRKQDNNDDASSLSSDSSDSDSDSDSDDDDETDEKAYTAASTYFTARVRQINAAAEASRAKGKKAPADIERERAAAIEKAAKDKAAMEERIEQKRTKRAVMREFQHQRRDLKREHRQARRELRKKGLGKKSKEWKESKKRHQEKKKALRHEKNDVRRQFREARKTERSERRGKTTVETGNAANVWVVVENLA
ncbi:uncharacterized protein CC84DRAFT_1168319 [Paraphaeosphaeria sporulosa]|uniref:Uncharacterized protein n=1 Tax=Paraphaeosphaeria sporulosa TaxID=1460663 RepID=A0A177C121_9PLEO|nr:uncharacterized protein CC84DRAFT_1168319 [Paraphaeosphaeria sporulosa]OAG01185.1 hypothetical protein CC84DRAFT_1168319 [Paraphaeosphaeria sporulosa]